MAETNTVHLVDPTAIVVQVNQPDAAAKVAAGWGRTVETVNASPQSIQTVLGLFTRPMLLEIAHSADVDDPQSLSTPNVILEIMRAKGFITYGPIAPTITLCTPDEGAEAGGTAITLTGTGFSSGGAGDPDVLTMGGEDCTSVVVVSDTSITAVTPAGTGAADIVLTNNNGTVTVEAGEALFTYV